MGDALALALIIVLVLLGIAYITFARRGGNVPERLTNDASSELLRPLGGTFAAGLDMFFRTAAKSLYFISKGSPLEKAPPPTDAVVVSDAPFEGGLNKIELRTWNVTGKKYDYIVEGSGDVNVSPGITIHYTYRLDNVMGLIDNLKIAMYSPFLEVGDIASDGSQKILLNFTAHLDELRGVVVSSATVNGLSEDFIHATCPQQLRLLDINFLLRLELSLVGCGGSEKPRIASVALQIPDIAFSRIDYTCTVKLIGIGVKDIDLNNYAKTPIYNALNKDLKKILIKFVGDYLSKIDVPLLACARVPSGCVLGASAGPATRDGLYYIPTPIPATPDRCKTFCREDDGCALAWYGKAGGEGRCMLYGENALKSVLNVPPSVGSVWLKKSGTTVDGAIVNSSVSPVAFAAETTAFDRDECERRAKTYGLSAWNYDVSLSGLSPKNTCYLFKAPYNAPKLSLALNKCGKNTQHPNWFDLDI